MDTNCQHDDEKTVSPDSLQGGSLVNSGEEAVSFQVERMLQPERYSLKRFDCGNQIINSYFRNSLKKAVKENNTSALVAIQDDGAVLGVCTYTPYSLGRDRLSSLIEQSLPSEVGCIRLVMLGVEVSTQGMGVGRVLLTELFVLLAAHVSAGLNIKGVYLDAEANAVGFYDRLGFVALGLPDAHGATPMFIEMTTLQKSILAAQV